MKNKTPYIRGGLLILGLGLGVGSCVGTQASSGHTSKGAVPASSATAKIKTIIQYLDKPRDVEKLPKSCRAALDALSDLKPNEAKLINVYQLSLVAMADGHTALTAKDGAKLNRARTKLYGYDNDASGAAQELMIILWPQIDKDLKACRQSAAYDGSTG